MTAPAGLPGFETTAKGMEEVFFSVNEENGSPVTGVIGGFAVGRMNAAKAMDDYYFSVDSTFGTRVYATGVSGGFAVGRYGLAKGMDTTYLKIGKERILRIDGGLEVGKNYSPTGLDTLYFSVKMMKEHVPLLPESAVVLL